MFTFGRLQVASFLVVLTESFSVSRGGDRRQFASKNFSWGLSVFVYTFGRLQVVPRLLGSFCASRTSLESVSLVHIAVH